MNSSVSFALRVFLSVVICFGLTASFLSAQSTSNHGNKFEDLGFLLPSANAYRNMDGAPGPDYWQQRCDYEIECTLDAENQRLMGKELITYYNRSPQPLRYLWLQLDENQHAANNDNQFFDPSTINPAMSEEELRKLEPWRELEKYGVNIEKVTDEDGEPLNYTINQTMMRVDLPAPLKPGDKISFRVNWNYNIIDRLTTASFLGRGGYEYFPEDDNYLFVMTQWYPRLCAYTDYEGWQNKQFTGRGEFALTFGDFLVKMTVPEDFVLGSTGECLNYSTVLTETQLDRWNKAQESDEPIEIVTLDEAKKNERKKKASGTKTWIYQADNVRDFAWTASRKFIWDAMAYKTEAGKKVMCMSYYPKDAYPIYRKFSTKTVAHTLKVYSKFSIPYPYPIAISVEAQHGMEYPMICFNPGRAEPDGTYTEEEKLNAISVIIHEVGHNYFPMIINSDERQWSWFDEGINTFVEFLAEQEFDNNYKTWNMTPELIADYMRLPPDQLEPIMTASDNIVDFFTNAYLKPSAGLVILRETIMGRELFDFAFKEYCRRWAFKHPTPADFFRTMEDASGMDLDWFWRGWFFGIEPVDISIDSIKWYKVDLENNPRPITIDSTLKYEKPFDYLTRKRNRESGMEFAVETDPGLKDFYTDYRPWETEDSVQKYRIMLFDEPFSDEEKQQRFGKNNYYHLYFSNKGGMVMPVILEWTFEDGTKEVQRIPVEIWRKDEAKFTKVFVKDKKVTSIRLDPYKETADIDESNNNWPVKQLPSKFQVFKQHNIQPPLNPMQKARMKKEKGPK